MNGGSEQMVCTVAIVGAGPAGLAAALTLSRALQDTIVFDATGAPRNAASRAVGSLLGRDAIPPDELRRIAFGEIERYGFVQLRRQDVDRIEGSASRGFTIVPPHGAPVTAERVLLACGVVDRLPEIEGLSRFWGSTVINCPFCDGFEVRGRPWGVYVNRPEMLDVAEIYRTWTDDVMLFLGAGISIDGGREADLLSKGFRVERRPVRRLLGDESQLAAVELDGGERIERAALILWPLQSQTDLVRALGVALDDAGCVIVDDGFRTDIDGLYAAGDLVYFGHQNVNTAIHMGNLAAAAIVLDLSKAKS